MATHHLIEHRAQPAGVTWRAARPEDAVALYQLYAAVDLADGLSFAGNLADISNDFHDPATNPETDTLVAISPSGGLIAAGWIFVNPQAEHEHRAFLWGCVHPGHRLRGLGDYLLTWMEGRAEEILRTRPGNLPRNLRASTPSTGEDRIRLLERHGFEPVRQFYKMRRDLRQEIPDLPLMPGIRLVAWSPDLDEALRGAMNAAFEDHWGHEPWTSEAWNLSFAASSSFRPEMSFVALDGEQVVGGTLCRIPEEDNARQGLREGWINLLGVRRGWRNAGLASSLLRRSMLAFQAAGLETAGLGVDTENLTGALRLYENLGFRPVQRTIQYNRPVVVPEPAP